MTTTRAVATACLLAGLTKTSAAALAAIFVLTTAAHPATAQETAVRVHVFTARDASGLTDKPTSERIKAVEDINKRLAKNKAVTLVDREAAQITIEVTSAGAEDTGRKSAAVAIPVGAATVISPGTSVTEFIGRATLTSGTFTTTLTSSIGPFGRSYGENLARKAEDWLKDNRAALVNLK